VVLEAHPLIAFWWRQSTGAMKLNGRYVKFSFRGASDLMAVTVNGRFVACEVKGSGGRLTKDQEAFLENVRKAGGIALCVNNPELLARTLTAEAM
jgi:hypothetical protein